MKQDGLSPAPIVGGAIGDALGVWCETMDRTHPALLGWDGMYRDSSHHKSTKGQWSDDTQMTVALSEALILGKGFNPEMVSKGYLGWYQGNPRGIGGTIETAMRRLQSKKHWSKAGVVDSLGAGTAMRASPLGLFYSNPQDVAFLIHAAITDAYLTHKSKDAAAASLAIALGVHFALTETSRWGIFHKVMPYLPGCDFTDAMKVLAMQGSYPLSEQLLRIGYGRVVETVTASWACFLNTSTYEDAVLTAVRNGGDSDTVAQMAGSLAGTFYGYEAIPDKYKGPLERLEDLNHLDKTLFQAVA